MTLGILSITDITPTMKQAAEAATETAVSPARTATVTPLNGQRGRKGQPLADLTTVNAMTILATNYPALKWIVPDLVPEGLTILAGRQKLGKTWLALDWSIAVAMGGLAMGSIACEQGDVLYADFENGERRVKDRLMNLCPTIGPHASNLSRLSFLGDVANVPTLDAGFIPALERWRAKAANPRLVVLDVVQRIKPTGNAARNSYENDYAALAPLQQWATSNGIGVVGLMHTRKGGADDPLESVNGSNGQSACADTTVILDNKADGITLYVRGRDVAEAEKALRFDSGHWSIIGEAAAVHLSDERRAVLDVLFSAEEAMSPTELAGALGKSVGSIKKLVFTMAKAGELVKEGRGRYRHPNPDIRDDEPEEGEPDA